MTTSEHRATGAFVWLWLPGDTEPTLAGRVEEEGDVTGFAYGRRYLDRPDAISLFEPELPLRRGTQRRPSGALPLCLADAAPDGWGQRVIENRLAASGLLPARGLGALDYLLASSGDDRFGALDVTVDDEPPNADAATATASATELSDLLNSAEKVEAGVPLAADLDRALIHGTSIGGARPKALVVDGDRRLIAKFGSTADPFPVVRAEYVAMDLARACGLVVAPVRIDRVLGKDVLLVERFDRPGGDRRRVVVSAKTILGLDEYEAWYATYWELANAVRVGFTEPDRTLRELFARITFNVIVGNTDDHARNHAAFWDGSMLSLTPAYDICPQVRGGGEASQAMAIAEDGFRRSQLRGCVERAAVYHLDESEARDIVDRQIEVVTDQWSDTCDRAGLGEVERAALWGRQVLNPYALEGYR